RLHPDPAVEHPGRDHRADAPCRRLGGQLHRSNPRAQGHRPEGGLLMKVVLFCGGLGTRIREYSEAIPKPMIPVGHQPILWHVMQYYSHYGHRDFILCLGYKANVVKEFFLNYRPHVYADCTVSGGHVQLLAPQEEDWRVTLI